MAPRSSWKGFLKLSLISVPVKAFTANNTSEDIRLNQLHSPCNSRIKYRKVCPEHGEVTSDEIVSGYEYTKDQYVIIDTSELDKLRPESDKAVRIEGFVKTDELDPLYHAGKTYFLLPDGVAGGKPYALLHKGMTDADVNALAQVVVAGREQLVLVRPHGQLLAMTVLHVAKKMKRVDMFEEELSDQKMTAEEQKLTDTLIEASLIDEFDFTAYTDTYVERLGELIQLKVDGQEIVEAPDREEPKIINLMDALKKSVAEAQSESRRKMAASVTKPSKKKTARKKAATKKKAPRRKTG